jgi:hypothetical protein
LSTIAEARVHWRLPVKKEILSRILKSDLAPVWRNGRRACKPGIATKGMISLAAAGYFESGENTQSSITETRSRNAKAPATSLGLFPPGLVGGPFAGMDRFVP